MTSQQEGQNCQGNRKKKNNKTVTVTVLSFLGVSTAPGSHKTNCIWALRFNCLTTLLCGTARRLVFCTPSIFFHYDFALYDIVFSALLLNLVSRLIELPGRQMSVHYSPQKDELVERKAVPKIWILDIASKPLLIQVLKFYSLKVNSKLETYENTISIIVRHGFGTPWLLSYYVLGKHHLSEGSLTFRHMKRYKTGISLWHSKNHMMEND